MRLTHFFIDRPRFATVLSVFVTSLGLGALAILPVAQYPEIVPPTVKVTTSYPGASAETVARTVATPLEQEINGVENMLYMNSQSTGDGNLTITVTFAIGTDLNIAQMLTQNRVQDVLTRLPEDVQHLGVQVRKAIPSILLAIHLYSPDESRDTLSLSNYATLHIKDVLARLPGVGDVQFQGGREYAMRIWLDPDKAAAYDLTASDVLSALRAQNLQVSAGILNQPPTPSDEAYQINVEALGRLSTPEQFANIIVKSDNRGRVTRVRDIGWVEIGAADYGNTAYMDRSNATALLIFAEPGANSLTVDREVVAGHAGAEEGLSARRRLDHHLRSDDLHCEVDPRGHRNDFRGNSSGGGRRIPLPAELASDHHPGHCDSGLPRRDVHDPCGLRHIAQQPVPVRPRARGRHRRRRRDRRRRKRRAQYARRRVALAGSPSDDGRSRWGADLDRPHAVRRLRAFRLHLRNLRAVLPSVRGDDLGLNSDLLLRLADAQPRPLRRALQDALRARSLPRRLGTTAAIPSFQSLQSRLRPALFRLLKLDASTGARNHHRARDLCGADRRCRRRVLKDADRLHPRAGPGLPHQRRSASGRFGFGPDREGRPARHRHHSGNQGRRACGALRRPRCDDLHGRVECSNDLLRLAVTLQSRASGRDREHGDSRPA